jgi:hypothetical protein
MKRLPIATILTLSLAALEARADDARAVCFDASEKAQTLRADHKLIEARDQFRLCLAPACPATMRADCSGWLGDAEKAIPTVVFSAKDAAGNDVLDVTVTLDERVLTTKLDGTAVPVNPGVHTFRFQWPDGSAREHQVLVVEGQKDMVVAVSLAPAATTPVLVSPSPAATPPPLAPPPTLTTKEATPSPWRTMGWVAGGVGVVGLGLGAVFTGVTLSDRSAAGCDAAKKCTNYGALQSAMNTAPVAGVGLIGGGAFVVAGALLLIVPHSKESPPGSTASLRVAPFAIGRGGGALVQGEW